MSVRDNAITIALTGDVMTGRGIDQVLPYPADPRLWEPHIADARGYIELAEQVNGPIPRPVDVSWPWGVVLEILDEAAPAVRLINLETSITGHDHAVPGKPVHYRMNPDNAGCLAIARPDACALANNHVLDFGQGGLADTLDALAAMGTQAPGAGPDAGAAARPATVPVRDGHRVLIFSFGTRSSGIPADWAATPARPGIHLLPDLSDATAAVIVDRVQRVRQPGDIVVVSVHWGSNWGYHVPAAHIRFAHRLVDDAVDLVHGHSSHHPRPIEIYRGKVILYGCGDLLNDYEGIAGHEEHRDDLRLLYLAAIDPDTGRLDQLQMAPLQARRMRLCRAASQDVASLRHVLDRINRPFATPTTRQDHDMITIASQDVG